MIEQIVNNWTTGVEQELIQNYNKLGLRASGAWASSISNEQKTTQTNINVKIFGNDYTQYLENGRGKNKNQSPEGLRKWVGWAGSTFLKDWVKAKGKNISPFAIAYKIAREGIKVPNANNKGGLVTDVITDQKIKQLYKEVGGVLINEIKSDIINDFKS